MDPTHRDRQDTDRFGHPPRNKPPRISGSVPCPPRDRADTRPILVQWAQQATLRFESDSTPKQPNPEEPSPDVPEDSPGSTTPNAKDLVTQSTGQGGSSLTL